MPFFDPFRRYFPCGYNPYSGYPNNNMPMNMMPQNNFGFNQNGISQSYIPNIQNMQISDGIETEKKQDENKVSNNNNKFAFEKNNNSNKELLNEIEAYIQNEKNSNLFYKYLSNKNENEKYNIILMRIADGCNSVKNDFIFIYDKLCGKNFECRDANIDNNIDFIDGIKWAMEEECSSIDNITNTYSIILNSSDYSDDIKERFSILLYRKYARFACLNFIYNIAK